MVNQKTAQRLRTTDERAGGGERLPARVDGSKHAAGQSRLRDATAPAGTAHAGCVSFIHDEFGVIARRERCEIPKRRAVAVHAEDAFDYDESRSRAGKSPAKFGFESVEIEMRENNTLALCEANAIDQAGMVRAVRKNGVFGTENGAQQSDIRRIPRSEIQRGFGANPPREIIFNCRPDLVVAGQQTRAGGRDAR